MKSVEEIKRSLQEAGIDMDGWKIQDRSDNYVKLVPPNWTSVTYQMLGQIELALDTDRMNLKHEDSEPGYAISEVTWESGTPGYVYIDVYDK